jgi:hypothetical protein
MTSHGQSEVSRTIIFVRISRNGVDPDSTRLEATNQGSVNLEEASSVSDVGEREAVVRRSFRRKRADDRAIGGHHLRPIRKFGAESDQARDGPNRPGRGDNHENFGHLGSCAVPEEGT